MGAETSVSCARIEDTVAAGETLASRLGAGELVSLEGDLGAGKTVFVRGLASGLGHAPEAVGSPSFVLAVEHAGGRIPLLHVDLYRLADGSGIDDVGIDEALDEGYVVAVEWGERLPRALSEHAWRVIIATPGAEAPRSITIVEPTQPR